MNISPLREFMVFIPTCQPAYSQADLWRRFQQTGADQLVIVDEQQVPLGLLRLNDWLAIIGLPRFNPPVAEPTHPDGLANLSLQQLLADDPALLTPIRCLGVETDWIRLVSALTVIVPQIVLVDATGQYLGLLDQVRVLHELATQSIQELQNQPSDLPQACPPAISLLPTSGQIHLDPLIDLLERLPLPLMLQTSTGRVITQNLVWRQRVGAIQHPQQIRRAAARILEANLTRQTNTALPVEKLSQRWQASEAERQRPQRSSTAAAESGHPVETCQVGPEPNTCVCVCSMDNGQDRVWRFIKVPMGVSTRQPTLPAEAVSPGAVSPKIHDAVLSNSDWARVEATQSLPLMTDWGQGVDPALEHGPFKLASLRFRPDPAWRSLIQTETLWLVLAQDMTEEQQVAQELATKNADLIQLNRLKDEFLACISHELKTPLTAVLGMSSLLKDQLLGELNERQVYYARLIYQSGRHLVGLINSILDLTRIETGQLELLLEQLHLPSLCQYVYEQAQRQYLETHSESSADSLDLHFQLEMQPDLEFIVADELRLRQMLTHLLSNALKFTDPGGEIGLRVESWEGWIALTVWDTGIGIPAEKQHLIFQKFQQLEQPLTRQFHGAGLGLVLTQRLARLHGGDISFTSVPGQGSQFTLLLPPVPPQAAEDHFELRTSASPRFGAKRNRLVILVESDALLLEERVEQLTELGYRAVVARSGTEAIEKARRLQPAAILLNPMLPLLSGWDVLMLLKTDETTRDIPVVMTTVRVKRDQSYQAGADGFLGLPVDITALQHCLEQVIPPVEPELPVPVTDLTVLHLYEENPSFTLISNPSVSPESQGRLHPHCRILEVDDLEQADLLARVWKPDVVLIDCGKTEPHLYMQQLSRLPALADLPLITLSAAWTHAANQISGLAVFPYLATIVHEEAPGLLNQPNLAELMQVMRLAAKVSWIPHILIVDCAAIASTAAQVSADQVSAAQAADPVIHPPVRALVQYLQTAGFRSAVGKDWHKVSQQLQHQGADLLLLCISLTEPALAVAQMVQTLESLPERLPIVVWNYQPVSDPSILATAAQAWQPITTEILPDSLSILELLAHLNRILAERRRQTEEE